eukprot:CAMPEP_0194332452 /NCGR_PEP_ID=MMETSP0171-20130528/59195_1 /TAXON_ID=218684 /ORGANISM="Corethron pennatum, Strain L29A3" /LENGTH=97 /DNA_ID=CAMNT_0039094307 /DNA_START=101 /DNA_END=390 /DNA_ORIENTATION=-
MNSLEDGPSVIIAAPATPALGVQYVVTPSPSPWSSGWSAANAFACWRVDDDATADSLHAAPTVRRLFPSDAPADEQDEFRALATLIENPDGSVECNA